MIVQYKSRRRAKDVVQGLLKAGIEINSVTVTTEGTFIDCKNSVTANYITILGQPAKAITGHQTEVYAGESVRRFKG